MKVLLFMDVFIFGGVEKMLKELSDHLVNSGYTVELLLIYKSKSNSYLDMLDSRVSIKYIWDIDEKPNILKRLVFWFNVILPEVVARKVNTAAYDWVITFKDDYQCNLISSHFRCKKIAWIHNITEDYQAIQKKGFKYKLADVMYRNIYKRYLKSFVFFDKIVCVSNHARDALESRCPMKIKTSVIYNYVDKMQIEEKSIEYKPTNVQCKCQFVYVGRLSAEKGVFDIVKAVCNLRSEAYDIGLVVVGEGYQLDELKKYVQKRNCEQSIHFVGAKKNPYPFILNSDVVICGSKKESFGLVVLEAILLGKWVISTRCGGPEELIVNGENGVLVSGYADLVDAMKAYTQNRFVPNRIQNIDYLNLKEKFFAEIYSILEGGK